MVMVTIKLTLLFLCIKFAVSDKGSVNDVYLNAKNYCPRGAMEAFFVQSEIQCTHRCLRKKCKLLNYNTKTKDIENCEIFTDIGDCSILTDQEGWKAIIFQIDVCSSAPCKNGATCSNFGHTYECKCSPGYEGTNCDQDIDECTTGTHNCHALASCTNTAGSFTCSCNSGYSGDGVTCTENIAYKRGSSQSSVHIYQGVSLVASFANDGNRDGRWEVCAWTKADQTPWWKVDLGRIAAVKFVIIRSGSTILSLQINPFHIAVGNDGSKGGVNNPKCVDSGKVLSGEIKRFDCPTVMQGRYLTVFLIRAEMLQVCELEVYE